MMSPSCGEKKRERHDWHFEYIMCVFADTSAVLVKHRVLGGGGGMACWI